MGMRYPSKLKEPCCGEPVFHGCLSPLPLASPLSYSIAGLLIWDFGWHRICMSSLVTLTSLMKELWLCRCSGVYVYEEGDCRILLTYTWHSSASLKSTSN
jgi:hypothetical protein